MSYLILSDYYAAIQIQSLQQIIGGDNSVLASAALKAQQQCVSYLVQKYDTTKEFTDTNVWKASKAYNAGDRVYLDADTYNGSGSYAVGDLCLNQGNIYCCTNAITGPQAFTIANWTLLGAQNAIFYVTYPKPVFDIQGLYKVGDQVFYKNKVYTAQISTSQPGHETILQNGTYDNIPLNNVYPDDINGSLYWGTGIAYSVSAGTLPTGIKFTQGDNRSQQLLEVLIDLTLYKIHSRISPRNIPDLRRDNYHLAVQWLKDCGEGKVTPNLPLLQPRQGSRVRYGGQIKNINSW